MDNEDLKSLSSKNLVHKVCVLDLVQLEDDPELITSLEPDLDPRQTLNLS